MATYLEVEPSALIEKAAEALKGNDKIVPPVWAPFVKTGVHRTHQPTNPDWWHIRVAAILRTVAASGPIGTNKLVVKYGGKQRRGHQKPRFHTGSGSIARTALQQLEAAGFVKHATVGTHKGRVITPAGMQLLDAAARKTE